MRCARSPLRDEPPHPSIAWRRSADLSP